MANDDEKLNVMTPGHLVSGPVSDRSCTDVLCCLLFIAMQVVIGCIAVYAFKNGNYK